MKNHKKSKHFFTMPLVSMGLIASVYVYLYQDSIKEDVVFVENKERILNISKDGKSNNDFMVYTEGEVFKIQDEIFIMHFSSGDIYNNLKIKSKCEVVTAGWRLPFLSVYKNIIEVTNCKNKG